MGVGDNGSTYLQLRTQRIIQAVPFLLCKCATKLFQLGSQQGVGEEMPQEVF